MPHIKAPLQLHYAENDERINASAPAYEAALKANHVTYEVYRYPGTQHGFNNDTTPRFDKDAAALAWQRTLEFFQKHLRGIQVAPPPAPETASGARLFTSSVAAVSAERSRWKGGGAWMSAVSTQSPSAVIVRTRRRSKG